MTFALSYERIGTDDNYRSKPYQTDSIVLAELALQMEFVRLSQLTGNPLYGQLANKVIEKIAQAETPIPGLYTTYWDAKKFTPGRSKQQLFLSSLSSWY